MTIPVWTTSTPPPSRVKSKADTRTVGKCTNCGAVEVRLIRVTGYRPIPGETPHYPIGFGCEVCD